MKKILVFIFLLSLFFYGYSQNSKIIIGVELSPNYSLIRGNSMMNDSKFGLSSGLNIDYALTSRLKMKSGLIYERKGAKDIFVLTDNAGNPISKSDIYFNFDYVTIPIIISYSFDKKLKYYIDYGVFVGYLIKQNYIIAKNIDFNKGDGTELYKRIDLGLSFGAGIEIPINDRFKIDLGFKDNFGLIKINNFNVTENGYVKTNSVRLNVGVKYQL